MKKRILSVLLALCMCLTFVPVSVFAEDLQQDNSISVLSITPDEGTYRTYVFKANGETISTQIVKNGDTLLEPQVPAQDGKVFTGWLPQVPFGTVSGLTGENKTIEVEAQFADGYHVYFKDNNGRIIATETVENGTEVSVANVNFPVGSDEAITGWYTDKAYTNKVDSVTINGADITLYAKVEKGYWLTFESNGGSYVAPAFYANGTPAAAPDKPTKSGYTFAGWYTDENLMTAANFDNITESTTLYAKWTAGTETKYTVIHFWENANDDGYSFKESETKTGATGGTTNAGAKRYRGFTAQTITQQTIKNITGDNQDNVKRKIMEIYRALALEKEYSKDDILEVYLNTIYLGEMCYGVQTASQAYFGKDAADLTQEAFLRVWQKLPEFRLQAAFSTWLYRLTTNLCLDFMRGRKRRPTVPLEREDEEQTPLPEPKDPAPTPEEAALASEEQRRLRRALAGLSPEQRELLALRAVRDLNYAQIAELLGVPEGTVKSRLARAREALRKKLACAGTFCP